MAWVIALWVGFSMLTGIIAATRGRSVLGFFFLAMVLSPLVGLIAVFSVSAKKDGMDNESESVRLIECPYCAKQILAAAPVCKHCGKAQPQSDYSPTVEQWNKVASTIKKN